MDTLVFMETNKSGSSREAIKAAERLGFFTVLLTNKQKLLHQRSEFPDVHQMIFVNLSDVDQIKKSIIKLQAQAKDIKGILSFVDPFVHVAAALSKEFCPGVISPEPMIKMEDKVLTRELLKDLPCTPYYAIYSPDQSLETFMKQQKSHFPLILKSPLSTGSKDVLPVKDEYQLRQGMQKLGKKSKQLLLEEYLQGPQYLIEALVHDGKVHIVAIIEQEITFVQRFIVTGYCLLAEINQHFYENLYETVSSILEAFQLKNGACHLEMRFVNGTWKLIEINPRISGGAMNRIIEVGFGINLVEETIQLMLGEKPNLTKKHRKFVFAHYLTVSSAGKLQKVTGKNRCSHYPGVNEVYIKPRKGQIVQSPVSMGDRCGYILASSTEKHEAKMIARKAADELCFYLEQTNTKNTEEKA